jgi:hypothetical protein
MRVLTGKLSDLVAAPELHSAAKVLRLSDKAQASLTDLHSLVHRRDKVSRSYGWTTKRSVISWLRQAALLQLPFTELSLCRTM